MYLCLNKLMNKYGKRIVLFFYFFIFLHCIKPEETQSHIFTIIFSRFSFVSNTTNFFIHSLNWFVLTFEKILHTQCWFSSFKCPCRSQIYTLDACNLDSEENLFNIDVESIAFIIKILLGA